MRLVTVEGVDAAGVRRRVEEQTFLRGQQCLDDRAVVHTEWDDVEYALYAVVRDGRGPDHEVTVFFEEPDGAELGFAYGECTCPTVIDCEHVVAAALAAVPAPEPVETASDAAWEQSLGELLTPARRSSASGADVVPLAVELSLSIPPAAARHAAVELRPKLLARLVRPGRTGWVAAA